MSGTWDPPDGSLLYATPEDAALSQWTGTPAAGARVVEVRPSTDDGAVWVVVQLDVNPPGFHDLDYVTVMQTADGRWWAGSSSGGSS